MRHKIRNIGKHVTHAVKSAAKDVTKTAAKNVIKKGLEAAGAGAIIAGAAAA